MKTKIAINGFGRIGRNVLRQVIAQGKDAPVEVVAINDLTSASVLAHLLKYDSVHGTFDGEVTAEEGQIQVNGNSIRITSEKDPTKLPLKEAGVDLALECTGIFTKREGAAQLLKAGARKVLISAPSPDPDITIAFGVNHQEYDTTKHDVVSCASCTTNCLAPVAKVVLENFGTIRGCMTTVHSYTNDQRILDLPHSDLRRARAAALSMIPTTTGAAKALGLVIPALKGKVDGFAIRVPTPDVSIVDYVVEVERDVTKEEVNRALQTAGQNALKGVLGFCEEPLVSIDFIGNTNSSTVDAMSTMVVDKRLVKVVAWYDNEMGFSARMVQVARLMTA
jgi:glyceraldehyde 3-phosphate dehydrogenase